MFVFRALLIGVITVDDAAGALTVVPAVPFSMTQFAVGILAFLYTYIIYFQLVSVSSYY